MSVTLWPGDCRNVLDLIPDNSIDAIVTDPPYSLVSIQKRFGKEGSAPAQAGTVYARASAGFMGQRWDTGETAFDPSFRAEVLRVAKPGAHLVAFGGTRTYHHLASAIEAAGFDIRDQIGWAFGSGFPKSHNLEGAWEGWGTALKPAWEPIVLARKPLTGTVAENVQQWRTGAINIDGCRVEASARPARSNDKSASGLTGTGDAVTYGSYKVRGSVAVGETDLGRWPANLIHDGSPEVLECFPREAGAVAPVRGTEPSECHTGVYSGPRNRVAHVHRGDSGSAARFFYCPKASKRDRDEGLEAFQPTTTDGRQVSIDNPYLRGETTRRNNHPTVKPTELMRYLCRLVTPPGGIVLDPFMGSGSTGKAAVLEGFRFVGIEREAEYMAIAKARIDHVLSEYQFG